MTLREKGRMCGNENMIPPFQKKKMYTLFNSKVNTLKLEQKHQK